MGCGLGVFVQRSTDFRAGEGRGEEPTFKNLAAGWLGEG